MSELASGFGAGPENRRRTKRFLTTTVAIATMSLVVSGVGAGLLATAASSSTKAKSTIGIGLDASITGPIASLDDPMVAGVTTYLDYVNSHGGVDGHKLHLITKDDQLSEGTAVVNTRSFVSDKVDLIIGPHLSNYMSAVEPITKAAKIPEIGFSTLNTLTKTPYFYSSPIPDPDVATNELAAEGIIEKSLHATYTNASIVAYQTAAATQFCGAITIGVGQAGGNPGGCVYLSPSATSISAQVTTILSQSPNVVFAAVIDPELVQLDQGLRQGGFTGPIINYYAGADDAVLKEISDPLVYVERDFAAPSENIPAVTLMNANAAKFGESSQDTSSYFTFGYATAEIAVAGIKKACVSTCTSVTINKALSNLRVNLKGLSGPIASTPNNHNFVSTAEFFKWNSATSSPEAVTSWIP